MLLRLFGVGALALALLSAAPEAHAVGGPLVTGKCWCAIAWTGRLMAPCGSRRVTCTKPMCEAACKGLLPPKISDTFDAERPKRDGHEFGRMWSDSASLAPTDVSAARRVRKARQAPAAVAVGAMDRDGRYTAAPAPQTRQRAAVVAHRRASSPTLVAREAVRGAVAGGHAGVTQVCAGSSCGTVAAWAADKFRGLFADLAALGYRLGSPGCLSGGHMRNSLHHWGGACDLFNQVSRNRTALPQPPPSVQIELAAKHGLTSGCAWRSPDCGHFDLSGVGMGRRYARNGNPRG